MAEVKEGEIFKAYNSHMTPPKIKYHLCIDKDRFFIINSKPRTQGFNFKISPEDCSILTKECFIHYCNMIHRPLENFTIIDKSELNKKVLYKLIEHIKVVPTFTESRKKEIINSLEKAL